jgi:hypothetical protein
LSSKNVLNCGTGKDASSLGGRVGLRISVMEKKRGKNDHNINEHEKDEESGCCCCPITTTFLCRGGWGIPNNDVDDVLRCG